jgi:peptide/nickel transport system permease protein
MALYLVKRILYVIPVAFGVSLFCFMLVHIAPGDPLSSVLPPDAPAQLVDDMRRIYGFDRPLPVQFGLWLAKAVHGDLGSSIATGRPVVDEISGAIGNTFVLAMCATVIGFALGCSFGFVAGYFRGSWLDRLASFVAVIGVSVPHYWLGIVLVIVFSVELGWLPAVGAGPSGSSGWAWDWAHVRHIILPAVTLSFIPMGIISRTVRALVAEILSQEYVVALRAKGLMDGGIFRHVVKNAAPTALAVMGLQLGYLLGGSILIETVFAWPGTGLLLGNAIFQRDLPLLQGTILVLAMFFVALNLIVDIVQALLDPRVQRA